MSSRRVSPRLLFYSSKTMGVGLIDGVDLDCICFMVLFIRLLPLLSVFIVDSSFSAQSEAGPSHCLPP